MESSTFGKPLFSRTGLKISLAFSSFLFLGAPTYAQKEYDVIKGKWIQYSDPGNLLNHHLTQEAFDLIQKGKNIASGLKTTAAWRARQTEMKKRLWKVLGPIESKTPLNPVITGSIQKKDFKIENIIFESQPGYFVTATLFIPNNLVAPAPAVLFCTGHSAIAFRRDIYQLPLLNLVKKGFVVLAFDPVAQGERMQYMDEKTGKSRVGGSTHEHSYPAPQSLLIGKSVARHFVWDGIRAIDYLATRKEVDMSRIGVHGLSGGGTQAAYIAALDDRVLASAPSGYITGFKRLLESVGAQDGEQNFYHGLAEGLDHADLLEIRAPKPTLVMATTRDFFNITGTRETVARVKKAYNVFGKPDHIALVEGDYEHGYTQNIREGMYAFFQKHLRLNGTPEELPVEYLTEKELQKTETGQLASSRKSETMFTLNLKDVQGVDEVTQKKKVNIASYIPTAVAQAKVYSGFRPPSSADKPVFTGRTQKDGYVIEKYFIKGEGNYPIPYLLFIPEQKGNQALLYIHPAGKGAEAKAEGEIERFVRKGITVLAPDLIGTGELTPANSQGDAIIQGVSYNLFFTATLIGRSILGIQVSDLLKLNNILKNQFPKSEILGIAKQEMGPVLLHAAAFDKSIKRVAMEESFISYRDIAGQEYYKTSHVFSLVPGALLGYDLPDLMASLAPRKLLLLNTTNGNGERIENSATTPALSPVSQQYKSVNADQNWQLLTPDDSSLPRVYTEWIK